MILGSRNRHYRQCFVKSSRLLQLFNIVTIPVVSRKGALLNTHVTYSLVGMSDNTTYLQQIVMH